MTEWVLTRQWFRPTCTKGILEGDDLACFTLEPPPPLLIPARTYRLVLTVSGRAQKGELWCPAAEHKDSKPEDFVLPQFMDVPGRTGIRAHALNWPKQTEGCVGVGFACGEEFLENSRAALIKIIAKLKVLNAVRVRIKDEPLTTA